MQEQLTLITAPAVEPVSLADAKAWCRVDITDDDSLISGLISAARVVCEAKLKKALINRQYAWYLDFFPNRLVLTPGSFVWDSFLNARLYPYTQAQVLTIPKPPLVSIDSIQYYDPTQTLQTLSPSAYVVEPGVPGRVSPNPGTQWPITQDRIGAAVITFTGGQGTSGANLLPNEVLAIKMLVSHWYRNREAVVTGAISGEVPKGVDALLASSKWGFYA